MSAAPGPLIVDLAGPGLTAADREVLEHPLVGGVLLFARNCERPDQLAALVAGIRAVRPGLLVAVDQEGGRVQRFRKGFTGLPPMAALGRAWDRNPSAAVRAARALGWLMAAELRERDIDLSFVPVLDLAGGNAEVIGDRALHADPEVVTVLARAYVAGMGEAGMAATGKHFPGHGSVQGDSHALLPVDDRDRRGIEETDLRPFAALADGTLGAVMVAHVRYPDMDELPASLSGRWLRDVLRARLGFAGAAVCDDLSMAGAAVAGDMLSRAEAALEAGNDLLPVCNDRRAVELLLDRLRWRGNAGFRQRVDALCGRPWRDDPDRRRQAGALAAALCAESEGAA